MHAFKIVLLCLVFNGDLLQFVVRLVGWLKYWRDNECLSLRAPTHEETGAKTNELVCVDQPVIGQLQEAG